jgi:hypothetical protein
MTEREQQGERWTETWPEESGSWWWLYARVWGDKKPTLYPVQVRRIANGVAYIASGHFLFKSEVEGPAFWTRIVMPPLPPVTLAAQATGEVRG